MLLRNVLFSKKADEGDRPLGDFFEQSFLKFRKKTKYLPFVFGVFKTIE